MILHPVNKGRNKVHCLRSSVRSSVLQCWKCSSSTWNSPVILLLWAQKYLLQLWLSCLLSLKKSVDFPMPLPSAHLVTLMSLNSAFTAVLCPHTRGHGALNVCPHSEHVAAGKVVSVESGAVRGEHAEAHYLNRRTSQLPKSRCWFWAAALFLQVSVTTRKMGWAVCLLAAAPFAEGNKCIRYSVPLVHDLPWLSFLLLCAEKCLRCPCGIKLSALPLKT